MENINSFDDLFKQLQSYIKGNYSIESYSEAFSSLKQNHEQVGMVYNLLWEANLLPIRIEHIDSKSSKESIHFRERGNKEFLQKQDLLAVQTYSMSVAFAPINSEELALAFANRSAVTFSMKEYEMCLKDIDRALLGKYPEYLCYKLYERKGKCLKILGMNKTARGIFEQALQFLTTSRLDKKKIEAATTSLNNLLNSCSENDTCHTVDNKKCFPCISVSHSDSIPAASSLVQIDYSEELGRHLVASSDIEPGDVLVIEKPFASVLLLPSYYNYCSHCKRRCHGLIPCLYCVVAMYCSESCRSDSWDDYHKVECNLVPLLVAFDLTKIEMIALRTLLMATKQSKSLQNLMETVLKIEPISNPKTKGFNEQGHYDSNDYRTVHHLVGNMELRSNSDIFRRATIAAYILHLLDKSTNFFTSTRENNSNEELSIKFQEPLNSVKLFVGGLLLRYLMIVPSNAHEISEMCLRKVDKEVIGESVEIGGALYPVLSLINHSCDPNVVRHSYDGDLIILTAIQVITAGEQIFDNYGYHHAMHDVTFRQRKLWSQYHFNCQCRACKEDWPTYSELPTSNPVYLNPSLRSEVDKSSEIFHDVLVEVKSGVPDKNLLFLYAHLSLLHRTIKRPWKEYCECQEAMKHCLSLQANHYFE